MKIHVLSDLHTEFADFKMPQLKADLVVLAGDTATKLNGVRYAEANSTLPTLYVNGNHEYYGTAIPRLNDKIREATTDSHVHFLENDVFVLRGTRFLGCTLWTDFALLGKSAVDVAMYEAQETMNDYKRVRRSPKFGKLRPVHTRSYHLTSLNWLKTELAKPWNGKTVVITHHAPSKQSLDSNYSVDYLSAAYASDMEQMISESDIDLWIHGHTHFNIDYTIGNTRIVTNQRGYPDEPAVGFREDFLLDV